MSLTALDAQYQLAHTWAYGSLESTKWIDPCDGTPELLTVDNSIDPWTGLVSESHDLAGVEVSYDYDTMTRLIAERASEGAWVEIRYRMPTVSCFPGNCDSPGWELRTTVRGLGGEPLREYVARGTDSWCWVRD